MLFRLIFSTINHKGTMVLSKNKYTTANKIQNEFQQQTKKINQLYKKVKYAMVIEQLLLLLISGAICYILLG